MPQGCFATLTRLIGVWGEPVETKVFKGSLLATWLNLPISGGGWVERRVLIDEGGFWRHV